MSIVFCQRLSRSERSIVLLLSRVRRMPPSRSPCRRGGFRLEADFERTLFLPACAID